MQMFKIYNATKEEIFFVRARAHRQHMPSQTTIIGCSHAGAEKILAAITNGETLIQADGPHQPKIIGVETAQ